MSLYGRDVLKEIDLTRDEFLSLVDLARELKAARRERREVPQLSGRCIALLFEKTSTRTRCAFEVAAFDQGAHVTYLDPSASQLGHKESVADTARVLSRFYDAIEYRGSHQDVVEELAAHATVPVYNGLTDRWHPTQMFADVMTMLEHAQSAAGQPVTAHELTFTYVGDGRSNMGNSLLVTGALIGADVRLCAPPELWPEDTIRHTADRLAAASGARIAVTSDIAEAVADSGFVHTDVWVSMGEPESTWTERIGLLRDYRVDEQLMAATGRPDTKFMHCLPAFHDSTTAVGRFAAELTGFSDGVEVAHSVFESPASIVFDQAENRLHTIKAMMVATLADPD